MHRHIAIAIVFVCVMTPNENNLEEVIWEALYFDIYLLVEVSVRIC